MTQFRYWLSIILFLACGSASAAPTAEMDPASLAAVDRLFVLLRKQALIGSADAVSAAKGCYASLGKRPRVDDVRTCVVLDYLVCERVIGYCPRGQDRDRDRDSDWGQYRGRAVKAMASAGIKSSGKLIGSWESAGQAAYEKQVLRRQQFVLPAVRAGVVQEISAGGTRDAEIILTRSGVVDVLEAGADEFATIRPFWIRFRGKKVLETETPSGFGEQWSGIEFTHLAQVGDDDVLLGLVESAGSAWCVRTGSFMLVVKPDGRTFLEVFGCNTDYEASLSGNVLSVRHRFLAQDVGVASQLLIYDGSQPYEVKIHESEDGARVAGSGKDALRWVGKYPHALFDDPGERLRFLAIMDRKELRETRNRLYQVEGPVLRQGAVICARGWTRYWGSGAVGIEIASGQPFAWYEDIEADTQQSFGMEALAAPEDARKCVEGK
jgi:hypothetical protein